MYTPFGKRSARAMVSPIKKLEGAMCWSWTKLDGRVLKNNLTDRTVSNNTSLNIEKRD
jgi:hypothetical protein